MNCIRCKAPMKNVLIQNVAVDVCPDCHGIWLYGGELSKILEVEETKLAESEIAQFLTGDKCTLRKEMSIESFCPSCQTPMATYVYCYDSGIKIDRCKECNGIWLDDGELKQIIDYVSTNKQLKSSELGLGLDLKMINARFDKRIDTEYERLYRNFNLPYDEVRVIRIIRTLLRIFKIT